MSGSFSCFDLAHLLDTELNSALFRDYCPNGLQVQNRQPISRVLCGVTANLELIEAARAHGAQALLVHHGLFWKGDDGRLTGFRYERLRALLAADIALFAYHLPLDAHPLLGNNAQLAHKLGWRAEGVLPSESLVMRGFVPTPQLLGPFAFHIEQVLGKKPLVIGKTSQKIEQIAWCTGGAAGYFEHAIAADVDAYITGEISEQHVHIARESGVALIVAGHHATERYGVQALGEWLTRTHGLAHHYVEIDSPV
jgi:dinuclear metal center YbgI/SA1388 family protein